MTECKRCGEYAYYPVGINVLPEEHEQVGETIVLPNGWDNIDIICTDCAVDLTRFMGGAELQEEEDG